MGVKFMFSRISAAIILLIAITYNGFSIESNSEDSLKVYEVPSITVTTTRAVLGESPVPFSEVGAKEIENSYTVQDIPDLLSYSPSILFYSQNGNSIGYSVLTMRGFDQRRISVMINGIPQNDPEDHQVYWIDVPDIASNVENIQIQRGAGLTNYGSAAIGGSINLSTSNFINKKGIKVLSGIGIQEYGSGGDTKYQTNTNKFSFEISSGLVGKYAFNARLSQINSEGYRDRSFSYMNSYFVSAARFDKDFTTQINIFGGPISDGLAYTGLPKSYTTDASLRRQNPSSWMYDASGKVLSYFSERRKQEIEEFSQPHYEILNDWQINDNIVLKSALFYYSGDGFYDYDGSWADTSSFRWTADYGFNAKENPKNAIIRATVSNKHYGWIPRLVINHQDGELSLGAEIRFHRSEHFGQILFSEYYPDNFSNDYKFYSNEGERDIFSFFAREIYEIREDIKLSFELQLVRHNYCITNEKAGEKYTSYHDAGGQIVGNGGDLFNIDYLFLNPRVGINYNINEKMNLYAMAAFTSREPRMRNLYAADDSYFGAAPLFNGFVNNGIVFLDFNSPIIKPEKMLNFEIGTNFKNDYLNAGINLYFMNYYDELVKSGRVDINGNPIDENAPRTRHLGVEFSGGITIFSNSKNGKLDFITNFTLSNNEIIDYDFKANDELISLDGNPIAGFPNFMANFTINYEIEEFFVSLKAKYVGEFRTDNYGDLLTTNQSLITYLQNDYYYTGYYNDNKVDAYFVFDADLSYTFKNVLSFDSIKLLMQVGNIFNKLYAAGGEGKDFFPGAERNFFFGIEVGI